MSDDLRTAAYGYEQEIKRLKAENEQLRLGKEGIAVAYEREVERLKEQNDMLTESVNALSVAVNKAVDLCG
jgi:hypothetical protein